MALTKTDIIAKARRQLIKEIPFLGYILFQTPIHLLSKDQFSPEEVAWTDGMNIYIHEGYVTESEFKTLKFLLCHEAGHIVFKSFLRRGNRQPQLWNIATDHIINLVLIENDPQGSCVVPLRKTFDGKPFNICYNTKYHGWTAEAVYEDILNKISQSSRADIPGSSTNNKNSDSSSSTNSAGDPNGQQSFDPKTGTTSPKNAEGDQVDWSKVEDHVNTVIAQAAEQAAEAIRTGKANGRGIGASAFLEYVDVALSKQVSWKKLLAKEVRTLGFDITDYSRPSRRTIVNRRLGCNYYFPKLRGSTAGDVLLFVDTSASVNNESLEVFLGEINSCLRCMPKTNVYLYSADYDIKYEGRFSSALPATLALHGRGGTSFAPAFEEAFRLYKSGKRFSTLVYFTDGECSYPDIKPHTLPFKVIWCIDNQHAADAPFGKTIRIDVNA